MRRVLRFIVRICVALVVIGAVAIVGINAWFVISARLATFDVPDAVPAYDVALVFGTTPLAASGRPNRFFERRMDAAAQLFASGRVRHVLVSGDHGTKTYDEVHAMRDALVKRGVPDAAITLDHAGFRTLDSVVRAREVFGLDRAVIVTDDFHAPRALFLARWYGLKAVAFPSHVEFTFAPTVPLRECFARVLAVFDVLRGTPPKYLGERVELPIAR